MPTPPGRVLAIAKATCLRPIEHCLDPTAHSPSGFGLRRPQGLDRLHHHTYVDFANRHGPKFRRNVSCECVLPLLTMFRVVPAYCVSLDVSAGTIVERHCACGFDFLRGTLSLAALERVDLVDQQRALRGGLPSRMRETNFRKSP